MNFVEICKTIAINIFWVMAAVTQIIILCAVIIGIINGIFDIHKDKDE